MSGPVVIVVTIGLIAASAFFVAVEFALIAARRHRLEDEARNSRSARAALRSASELSVLLAGSQLGITVCTLALGAVTKPAVHHWLTPMISGWGAPTWVADVGGFVLALAIVTFLHLVVGEMAPKSWAIAHPERSAILLALPMRGFMWLTRPLIESLNRIANWCLRKVGVDPVNQVASGQDSDALRELVDHSATVGALDERHHTWLRGALELESMTVGDVVTDRAELSSVPSTASAADVREKARETGHLRLVVEGRDGVEGVVHVRDCLAAGTQATAGDLMRPAVSVDIDLPVYEALERIRTSRSHLLTVTEAGRVIGAITFDDVARRLLEVA